MWLLRYRRIMSPARRAMISVAGSARNDVNNRHTSRRSADRIPSISSVTDTTLIARGPRFRAPVSQSRAASTPRRCAINTSESTRITMSGARCAPGGPRDRSGRAPAARCQLARRTTRRLLEGPTRGSRRYSQERWCRPVATGLSGRERSFATPPRYWPAPAGIAAPDPYGVTGGKPQRRSATAGKQSPDVVRL